MKITNEQRLSILDEFRPERQQPGDVTVKMAKDDWGVSYTKARGILEKGVDDKILEKIFDVVLDSGKTGPGIVYRKVVE